MDIKRLLQEKQILCKVKADTDRDSLLDMMAETLAQGNVLSDKDAYLKAVMKREADMSTQTNGGIALPHACNSSVKKLGVKMVQCLISRSYYGKIRCEDRRSVAEESCDDSLWHLRLWARVC